MGYDVDGILEGLRKPTWEVKDVEPQTIKGYLDEIRKLEDKAYTLMMKKFPVGSIVEYYQGSVLRKGMVMSYAKNKCSMRVRNPDYTHSRVFWVSAVLCELENPVEDRTIPAGSNACKIRIRKQKEDGDGDTT